MEPAFELEILEQGWIDEPTAEYDPARLDLCSHGTLRLAIGGRVVADAETGEFTISTSALTLLRTLESDHTETTRVAEKLVLHCGMLSMASCPIGIDWSVTHAGDRVRLADVVRWDAVDAPPVRFAGLSAELPLAGYRDRVVAFALGAKRLFEGVEKAIDDDYDRLLWHEFWDEFDARLERAGR